MKYQWTLDTPWTEKEDEIRVDILASDEVVQIEENIATIKTLLDLGWIKPVEKKEKLTAEEIYKAITHEITTYRNADGEVVARDTMPDFHKLAAFLAEHLK